MTAIRHRRNQHPLGVFRKILTQSRKQPKLSQPVAVFVTVDEGGGYHGSGYIQPLDFFADGSCIPLIVVSPPFAWGRHVPHECGNHVSILKFIEANWERPTISRRGQDNLPNPDQSGANPYAPISGPAIRDLGSLFHYQAASRPKSGGRGVLAMLIIASSLR